MLFLSYTNIWRYQHDIARGVVHLNQALALTSRAELSCEAADQVWGDVIFLFLFELVNFRVEVNTQYLNYVECFSFQRNL